MKKIKFLGILMVAMLVVCSLAACGSDKTNNKELKSEDNKVEKQLDKSDSGLKEFSDSELLKGKHHVEMVIQGMGTLKIELDGDMAPISVTNFCELVKSGFYNGVKIHRILPDTLLQGGDPTGTGMGGPGYSIKGEFSNNGVENSLSHKAGAISMARSQNPDSAGSQFFICSKDCSYYDGQYAVFGYVTEGLEIVNEICSKVPVQDDNGTVAPVDQPTIEKIKFID